MRNHQPIFLLIGVPGSGKTWVTSRLGDDFILSHHDAWLGHAAQPRVYVNETIKLWEKADRPVLAEAPFSVSQIKDPLEKAGAKVIPVIIVEDKRVLADRYKNDPKRDGKDIPPGHLTRMDTYLRRASEYNAFVGNSSEVLEYLKRQVGESSALSRRAQSLGG